MLNKFFHKEIWLIYIYIYFYPANVTQISKQSNLLRLLFFCTFYLKNKTNCWDVFRWNCLLLKKWHDTRFYRYQSHMNLKLQVQKLQRKKRTWPWNLRLSSYTVCFNFEAHGFIWKGFCVISIDKYFQQIIQRNVLWTFFTFRLVLNWLSSI